MTLRLLSVLALMLLATSAFGDASGMLAGLYEQRQPPRTRAIPRKNTGQSTDNTKKTTVTKKNPVKAPMKVEPFSYEPGAVRIKDIADVQGVRGNQLVGYGLVVGLEGTGDGQLSIFTVQSVLNMLKRLGINVNVPLQQLQVKNVAAVIVTADLPAFIKPGGHIDVNVSSLGDAKSLQGGTLIQTPLQAANGDIYAVAQGPISIGGFNFGSGGSSVQRNFTNVGRIPRGAIVEMDVPTTLLKGNTVEITLREADFTTSSRIGQALRKSGFDANSVDASTISVVVPEEQRGDVIGFLAKLEIINVTPDSLARIVINERTGTVVVGGNVRLSPGAVAQGSLNIRVENTPFGLPPAPFNPNPGQVVPFQDVKVTEKKVPLAPIPTTTTVEQMVRALNSLGVTPRDLISILQAMRVAGMLNAQIEVI